MIFVSHLADGPKNIHYDRRVVRGNTYAAAITTLNQLQAQAAAYAATKVITIIIITFVVMVQTTAANHHVGSLCANRR